MKDYVKVVKQRDSKRRIIPFVWSGNWWIEEDRAWFVSGEYNILHNVNFTSQECEFEIEIPFPVSGRFRSTPRCIKFGDDIFCLPDTGECIWVYEKKTHKLVRISIDNPNNVRLELIFWWVYDNKIYVVSEGLHQLFEIDAKRKKITNCIVLNEKERVVGRVMVDMILYSLSSVSNKINCFDLKSGTTISYVLPDIGEKLYTICFDGKKFWLSGYSKRLYVWNKNQNEIDTIEGFPPEFGIYNIDEKADKILDCKTEVYNYPTFVYSVDLGGYIWFIPYLTNKIIYVEKSTYIVRELKTEDEIETNESLKARNAIEGKYVLEYIRKNRYIGIFSKKNKNIFEIDVKEQKVSTKNFYFSYDCLKKMKNVIVENDLFTINDYFSWLLKMKIREIDMNDSIIGQSIYNKIKNL